MHGACHGGQSSHLNSTKDNDSLNPMCVGVAVRERAMIHLTVRSISESPRQRKRPGTIIYGVYLRNIAALDLMRASHSHRMVQGSGTNNLLFHALNRWNEPPGPAVVVD